MIAYMKGKIADIREDNLILEVNNIGGCYLALWFSYKG